MSNPQRETGPRGLASRTGIAETSPPVAENDLRVQLAAERTLLAWLRTGLAMMAFGFVVARFAMLNRLTGNPASPIMTTSASLIGIIMIAIGIFAIVVPPIQYRAYFRRIGLTSQSVFGSWRLVVLVSWALAATGIAISVYLAFVDIFSTPTP